MRAKLTYKSDNYKVMDDEYLHWKERLLTLATDPILMATTYGGIHGGAPSATTKYPSPYHGMTPTWPIGKYVGERVTSCDWGIEFEWTGSGWARPGSVSIPASPPTTAMTLPVYVGTTDTWPQRNANGEKAISKDTGCEYTWNGSSWVLSTLYEKVWGMDPSASSTGTVALQLQPEEFKAFEHYCIKEGTSMQGTLYNLLEDLLSRARIDPKDFKQE